MIGHGRSSAHRLDRLRQTQRLPAYSDRPETPPISDLTTPPDPPIALTPSVACSPETDTDVLWHIARHAPELRRWLVANPKSDAMLLEFVSQAGGPGVRQSLEILFESMEEI
jgi:hypothetical protein